MRNRANTTCRLWVGGAAALLIALSAPAHDGGFGHSRRAIFLSAEDKGLKLEYRIVQNRDEALVELALMDGDRDGQVSAEEKDRYFNARGRQLAASLHARTPDGEAIAVKFIGYELHHSLVQSYRFSLETSAHEILLDDRAFPHKPGRVQVRHGAGLKIEQAKPANLAHAERVSLRITRANP